MTWGQLIVLCIVFLVGSAMIYGSVDDFMDDIHEFKEDLKKWKK